MTPPDTECGRSVLVVDDDPTVRFLTREMLEPAGFRVDDAADGAAGVEAFDRHRPDIVLLDLVMPGMDGFEACAALRCRAHGAHTPILMMTGLDDGESIDRAYHLGATGFITKPINFVLLIHHLRYMLRGVQTAAELRENRSRLAEAHALARLGHWEWEPSSRTIRCSDGICEALGLASADGTLSLRAFLRLVHPEDRRRVFDACSLPAAQGNRDRLGYRIVTGSGSSFWIRQQAHTINDPAGGADRFAGIVQDITKEKQDEEKIQRLAYFDAVTGLPNRFFFRELLERAIENARRNGRMFAVLFLDVDRFKLVNDSLGHGAGDALLRELAKRLGSSIRRTDAMMRSDGVPGEDGYETDAATSVARLGGDEFVLLLNEVRSPEDCARAVHRLARKLAEPITIAETEITASVSIGISLFPVDGQDGDTLLKNADTAMYHAKQHNRGGYQFFTAPLNAHAQRKLRLEAGLRKALRDGELSLAFQPQVDLRDLRVVGLEALVRWNSPELGAIPPLEFIPVAEETGLILPLGEWVLRNACLCAAWLRTLGLPELTIAVNLSTLQLQQPSLLPTIAAILRETGLDPRSLELELTESVLMEDTSTNASTIRGLLDMGLQIAIDDFGTGYSCLGYLNRMPISALKIDRSFIRNLHAREGEATIVRSIIGLARNLSLSVVAEGVETEAQRAFLADLGCDRAQGFLISPPLPVDALIPWLREWSWSPKTGTLA